MSEKETKNQQALGGGLSDEDREALGEGDRIGHDSDFSEVPSPTDDSEPKIQQGDHYKIGEKDVGSRKELDYKTVSDYGLKPEYIGDGKGFTPNVGTGDARVPDTFPEPESDSMGSPHKDGRSSPRNGSNLPGSLGERTGAVRAWKPKGRSGPVGRSAEEHEWSEWDGNKAGKAGF